MKKTFLSNFKDLVKPKKIYFKNPILFPSFVEPLTKSTLHATTSSTTVTSTTTTAVTAPKSTFTLDFTKDEIAFEFALNSTENDFKTLKQSQFNDLLKSLCLKEHVNLVSKVYLMMKKCGYLPDAFARSCLITCFPSQAIKIHKQFMQEIQQNNTLKMTNNYIQKLLKTLLNTRYISIDIQSLDFEDIWHDIHKLHHSGN